MSQPRTPHADPAPLAVGVIGAGGMGAFHAESLARRIPGATLAAIADPARHIAGPVAERLSCQKVYEDAAGFLADPSVEAVVIASPARTHADLVEAASAAGKAIFCEKPMAVTLAEVDRAIAAARAAEVPLQVGFNRRFNHSFAEAHERVASGDIGTPQLLRSLTRDPGIPDPARVPPSTIFLETLIHDFDTLRFLNPGAEAVEVYAVADALAYPDYREDGLQDTAMVMVRFDNGAMAVAEASFHAVYGYDVRGEVFASHGMVTAGDIRRSSAVVWTGSGASSVSVQSNLELFKDAYVDELAHFVACVRNADAPSVTGEDAGAALAMALGAIRSAEQSAPVLLEQL